MTMFELAAITDEAAEEFDQALDCLAGEGILAVELRSLWRTNIADLSAQQVQTARDLLAQRGMRVVSIASPFLKCAAPGFGAAQEGDRFGAQSGTLEEHWGVLERSLAMCAAFEAPILRCFSFWRLPQPEAAAPSARQALRTAVARCREVGVTLALENEHACTIGTGAETAALFTEDGGVPGLTVVWDPGNAAAAGEQAYPDGYAAVRRAQAPISHVHIKDLARPTGDGQHRFVPAGEGVIDYPSQFAALAHDGYTGLLSLEPHLGQGQEGMRRCIAGLRASLAAAERLGA